MYVVNAQYANNNAIYPIVGIFTSLTEAKIAAELELDEKTINCDIYFYPIGKTWSHDLIGCVRKREGFPIWEMYTRKSVDYTPVVSQFITALANNDPIAHDMLVDITKS